MDLYVKGEKQKIGKGDWTLLVMSILLFFASAIFFLFVQYPSAFKPGLSIQKSNEIAPRDKIIIDFSNPVIPDYLGWKIKIYPEAEFKYHLENKNRRLVVEPEKFWLPQTEYNLSISGRNYLLLSFNSKFNFSTISYPKVVDFYPKEGAKDILLDIEDPIRISFDKSIDGFNIKFNINPEKKPESELSDDKKEISLMIKDGLDRGQKYSISIYGRYKEEGDEKYRKIGETYFETKPLPPVEAWEKDFNARLEQAKSVTSPLIAEGKYVDVNLKSQIMTLFENGKLLDAYLVSSGKRGMETPEGTYHIANKTPRAWSKEYGLFMPFWQALVPSGAFGIHELPEWPGGYKEGANHLGTPVSHGCVRLGVGPAERVYDFTDIGTSVIVHY